MGSLVDLGWVGGPEVVWREAMGIPKEGLGVHGGIWGAWGGSDKVWELRDVLERSKGSFLGAGVSGRIKGVLGGPWGAGRSREEFGEN